MFPKQYLDLFSAFPRGNTVFVAMPFGGQFDDRWNNIIDPAVRSVSRDGERMEPIRVDTRRVGESVITEILDGISTAAIVIAEVSTVATIDGKAFRNANVLYEVGIAQAVRLPTEILLFRSDNDPLLFDISNIRVNRYDPSDSRAARRIVSEAIVDAFKEIDLTKHRAVEKAADALDWEAFTVLATSSTPDGFPHPPLGTMGQVLGNVLKYGALERLLSTGAIQVEYPRLTLAQVKRTPDAQIKVVYRATPFGQAVMTVVATRMGGDDPQLMQHAAVLFDSE